MTDRVMFLLPDDKELQFPAMAILQSFVNNYQAKMKDPFVNPIQTPFDLEWDVRMPEDDWDMFQSAGLELTTARNSDLTDYECLCNMADHRLDHAKWPGRHAAQVCGWLSGIEAPPIPKLRKVQPCVTGYKWCFVSGQPLHDALPVIMPISMESVLQLKDGDITGVIGIASPETYMAVCMGLAVVEILPPDRPRTWLSKFSSAGYRLIETQEQSVWKSYIQRATRSVEKEIEAALARRGKGLIRT